MMFYLLIVFSFLNTATFQFYPTLRLLKFVIKKKKTSFKKLLVHVSNP